MAEDQSPPTGPDLQQAVALSDLADGAMLLGHVGDEAVLLARRGEEVFAVGATCTHYGGPLVEGLLVDDTVRCPWHHACFSLRSGEPLRPPALDPIARWRVERQGECVFVREKLSPAPRAAAPPEAPKSILVIGGGAAGAVAVETLRREGYAGEITLFSADASVPYDRPNLSKDYLAGQAPEAWIPLRSPEFYRDLGVELQLQTRVTGIDAAAREVTLENGARRAFDRLLIATGAQPVRLDVPGADLPHVHYLRSLADSRAIIEAAGKARTAVVVGASFIGLEVAASLRTRGLEVHVVAPDEVPLGRILGAQIGGLVRRIHEEHGVKFHLGDTVGAIDETGVSLKSGERLAADMVVAGIGVRPVLDLAEKAGLAIDRGVSVNAYLETSVPGIFAAGDLARWPDPHTGQALRVEHWVVAERQGRTAARNMLGRSEPFDAAAFFWSMHYDVAVCYVGHAERWDQVEVDGDIEARDCKVTYRLDGRTLAVATIGRDQQSLLAELDLERG